MCTQCMLTLPIHKSSSEIHIHVWSQVIFVSYTYSLTACWHCQVRIKSTCQVHIYLLHVDTAKSEAISSCTLLLAITFFSSFFSLTTCWEWHCPVTSQECKFSLNEWQLPVSLLLKPLFPSAAERVGLVRLTTPCQHCISCTVLQEVALALMLLNTYLPPSLFLLHWPLLPSVPIQTALAWWVCCLLHAQDLIVLIVSLVSPRPVTFLLLFCFRM